MIAMEDLYIMDVAEFTKDLYRMGNATWPAFTEQRAGNPPFFRGLHK